MLFIVLGFILARVIYWIFCRVSFKVVRNSTPIYGDKKKGKVKIMTVLGSGGHTTELLMLLKDLNIRDNMKLVCVIAKTDHLSRKKTIYVYSRELGLSEEQTENLIDFVDISRSREVGQSYLTSVFSSIKALSESVCVVFSERPDLLIVNGPGTCIPICYSALLLEMLFFRKFKMVFIESFCRTETLSISGLLILPFADRFIVAWPKLTEKYPKCEYLGILY